MGVGNVRYQTHPLLAVCGRSQQTVQDTKVQVHPSLLNELADALSTLASMLPYLVNAYINPLEI